MNRLRLLPALLLALLCAPTVGFAEYYEATGIPVQRSTISSAEFRSEFASIETGITDKLPAYTGNGDNWVVINSGGTGLTSITNAAAQTLLGVAIGSDVQAWDADLDAIAALDKTDSNFMVGNGSAWVLEDAATALTSIGGQAADADLTTWAGVTPSANGQSLVAAANYAAMNALLSTEVGTDFNAYDADLTTWATITPSANVQSLNSAANYAAMKALLNLEIGTDVNAYDADLTTWATVTPSANGQSLVAAANYAAMKALLNLEIGTDVQAWAAVLDNTTASYTTTLDTKMTGIEALADVTDATNVAAAGASIITSGAGSPSSTPSAVGDIYIDTTGDISWIATATASSADWDQSTGAGGGDLLAANNLSDVAAPATALSNLGGQTADADLTTWAGITPSANIQSFNAAATYAAARALLDVETGTDFYSIAGANAAFEGADATILKDADIGGSVQAYDADLTTLAALDSSDSNFVVGSATGFVVESGATARTSLGAQASDGDLTAIAALAKTNNNMMVANGSAWALETPAQVRTSLGLDALALLATVSNTQWSGTDLAVVNGGTGASTAAAAATALGVGTGDSPQFTGVNVGHASDSTITRAAAGEIELEGRPMIVHDNGAYTGGRIIVTTTTPTNTSGMDPGDMKFVY